MNIVDSFKSAFIRCFDYETRSSRSEFWWFQLSSTIISFIVYYAAIPLGLGEIPYYIINTIFLVVYISLATRRLHDIGISGWLQLIAFTGIGIIPLLIWFCTPGHDAKNKFGSNPLKDPYDFSQTSSIPRSHLRKDVFVTEEVSASTSRTRSSTREDSSNKLIDEGFKVIRKVKDK
tara:strand:+ start:76 stop:603 length:528 start_codon:yes stop_codon:yes gene_type:complete